MGLCELPGPITTRDAAAYQRAALAPFPARALREHWGLTRPPRATPAAPFAPDSRPDALLQNAFPGTDRARELSGILTLATQGVIATHSSVSAPIPFPWELVNITLWTRAVPTNVGDRYNFFVVGNRSSLNSPPPLGEPIFQIASQADRTTDDFFGKSIQVMQSTALPLTLPVPMIQVTEAGKRIALVLRMLSSTSTELHAIWTVRELLRSRHVSTLPVPALAA